MIIQRHRHTPTLLSIALCVGMFSGCATQSNGDKKQDLCTAYSTCDECIEGLQAEGKELGAAQTECGAAVIGCWATWEKPVTCAGKEFTKDE